MHGQKAESPPTARSSCPHAPKCLEGRRSRKSTSSIVHSPNPIGPTSPAVLTRLDRFVMGVVVASD